MLRLTGVGVAFVASLSFKTKFFRHHHMPLESCMVVIFAFGSYMMADSFGLSGIVAILFCGLVRSARASHHSQCALKAVMRCGKCMAEYAPC